MAKIPVTVYTVGPACVQCNTTKKLLTELGIIFTEVDLREHPDKADEFKALGHLTAPIVTTDIKIWSGFRYNKIHSLATYIRSIDRV
jgi:glutaredoxin-like protein NrdH